jgi:4-amino-4-deoxy-L-arabinose transferase-like glycosyltransferase
MLLFIAGLLVFTVAWCQSTRREATVGRTPLDFVIEGTVYGVAIWVLVSFLLMRLGKFSSPAASAMLLSFGALWLLRGRLAGLTSKKKRLTEGDNPKTDLLTILAVALIVAATVYYAWFPTYYMLGGRDPGIYFNFAAHISHTGGLNFYDPLLPELKGILGKGLRLGYPAFYSAYERGLSSDMGQLIPQFMHLFPSAAAHFFSWFGIEGLVRANSFFAGMAALAFFAFARALFGSKVSLLALLFLVFNPAFIWASRITLTEVLSLFIIFAGFYALVMALRTESVLWGGIAGVLLGSSILNRLDGSFAVLAVGCTCLYASLFNKRSIKIAWVALIAYAIFFILGFSDAYLHSYPQLYDLWKLGQASKLVYFNAILILVSIGLLLLGILLKQTDEATLQKLSSWLPAISIILLLFLFSYYYDIRPKYNRSFNGRALVELCWYITPSMPVLAILGAGFLTRDRFSRLSIGEWLPFVLFVLGTTAAYTWRPSIHPDHIWATRRWVPYVIPGLSLLGAYGFFRLAESYLKPRYVYMLVAALVAYYAYNASYMTSPFATRSMLAGYPAGYSETIKILPKNALLLVNDHNGQIPSVLKWVYQRDAYIVDWRKLPSGSLSELLRRYPERPVFIAGNLKGFPPLNEIGLEEVTSFVLLGAYPEVVRGILARKLYERWYTYPILRLNSQGNLKFNAGGNLFSTRSGMKVEEEMVSQGSAGNLVFGPYIPMTEGRYSIGGDSKTQLAHMDIVADLGATPIRQKPIFKSDLSLCTQDESRDDSKFEVSMTVVLPKNYNDIEFRFSLNEPLKIKLREVLVERIKNAE